MPMIKKRSPRDRDSRKARLDRARYQGNPVEEPEPEEEPEDKEDNKRQQHDARRSGCSDFCRLLLAFCLPIVLLEIYRPEHSVLGLVAKFNEVKELVQKGDIDAAKLADVLTHDISAGAAPAAGSDSTTTNVQAIDNPDISVKSDADATPKTADTTAPPEIPAATTNPLLTDATPAQPDNPTQKIHVPRDQTVAYVVPFFVSCGRPTTMRDAASVLRHSVHLNSAQNPASGSRFGYQMYALVYKDKCSPEVTAILEGLGYKVFSVDSPVALDSIRNDYVINNLSKGNQDGGIGSYVQLMAHQLVEEPIFVVTYINTLVLKPLDDLFLAIQHNNDTPEGEEARNNLEAGLERPGDPFPEQINHFFVRDYPHTAYDRNPVAHTPGFWVARKNPMLVEQAVKAIQEGDYVEGFGVTSGWGGLGYSLYFAGGLTMPGFYAYFLDKFHRETSVELDGCKFGHNGMDNKFRKPPRFQPQSIKDVGKCRSGEEACTDCTSMPVEKIYTILYDDTCFKPWKCYGEGQEGNTQRLKINTETTTVEHCLTLQHQWHTMRKKMEQTITKISGSAAPAYGQKGTYKSDFFAGHCDKHNEYRPMSITKAMVLELPKQLWGET